MKYLEDNFTISAVKQDRPRNPTYVMTADGYTKLSGAPVGYMVQLNGEKLWRRVYCWCFSNSGTLFVRVKGKEYIVKYEQSTLSAA